MYQNFKATDDKASVSIQTLAVLNIHYGGNRTVSKNALTEFLYNLTFHALIKKNDKIHLSFDYLGNLVLDILEGLAKKDEESVNLAKIFSKNRKQELDETQYELELPPELQIQEDLEKYLKKEKKPTNTTASLHFSPLLSEKETTKIYDDTKEDYLKPGITISKSDLDVAIENADEKNEKTISNVINPTPGIFVDYQLDLENQFKYKSNDIEESFALTNQIQERLDNVLLMMKENTQPPIEMLMQKAIEQIPDNPLNNEKLMKLKLKIYIYIYIY